MSISSRSSYLFKTTVWRTSSICRLSSVTFQVAIQKAGIYLFVFGVLCARLRPLCRVILKAPRTQWSRHVVADLRTLLM